MPICGGVQRKNPLSPNRVHPLPGVVEGMVGMGPGEAREIATTVGDTWWEPEPLRGVDLRCDITLKEVFEWDLPQVRALRPAALCACRT